MLCLECNHPIMATGMHVAMEQREHFAIVRHAEMCQKCAVQMFDMLDKAVRSSRFMHQSIDCVFCGHKLPITRLRFEIKDRPHRYMALCETCYREMRRDLMMKFPNFVTFIEKEWDTGHGKGGQRMPWPVGSTVLVKSAGKYHAKTGVIDRFRPLVVPWYGYDVKFPTGEHHFFHERDLDAAKPPEGLRNG